MPQFNIAFYPAQIFWLLVCFGVLYLCTRYIFLPRVAKIMAERERSIQLVTENAETLKAETEKLANDYALYEQETATQSGRMMQQAHEDVVGNHTIQEEHLLKVLKARTSKVESEITSEHHQVFGHIKLISGQFLDVIFNALYRVRPNKEKMNKAIDAQIKEGGL